MFTILERFKPYFNLLAAYNSEKFQYHAWREVTQNVLYAFASTAIIVANWVLTVLLAWYPFENDVDWRKCLIAVPLLATLLQFEMTFIAMVFKNRTIAEVIDQLQRAIDQRESFNVCSAIAVICYYIITFIRWQNIQRNSSNLCGLRKETCLIYDCSI